MPGPLVSTVPADGGPLGTSLALARAPRPSLPTLLFVLIMIGLLLTGNPLFGPLPPSGLSPDLASTATVHISFRTLFLRSLKYNNTEKESELQ